MSAPTTKLPRWADLALLPVLNLIVALLLSGAVVRLLGESPWVACRVMFSGALGTQEGIGYTLYYATNFIFTGLAVAVAFHAGLFNIGGEGQAYIGGLGCGLAILALDRFLPAPLMIPVAIIAAALFGAAWAAVPAWLQAYRGSHIVITTIMFNFIAYTLLVYLLVNVLKAPGGMAVESAAFGDAASLPTIRAALEPFGIDWPSSPLNVSFFMALLAAAGVYAYLWRTRAGYRLRTVGSSVGAAEYAGIRPAHQMMIAMAISGALAGFIGVNEIAGVNRRLLLDFVAG